MVGRDPDDFRIKAGRIRNQGARARSALPFARQVQIAVRKAGGNPNRIGTSSVKKANRFNSRGRGAKVAAELSRDSGSWSGRERGGGHFRPRRVVVKARVVKLASRRGGRGSKMRGIPSKAVDAHLRYLERDGVAREGEKGRVYTAFTDGGDGDEGGAFVERCRGDRHQFRSSSLPKTPQRWKTFEPSPVI